MGFDVLYMPPIHPIGDAFRKGRNNTTTPSPGDPGSPWAIGSRLGGHKAINPDLGTLADFDALINSARAHNIELALDIAFQCSPDHPWVAEHPDWFSIRPDGSIQYAENPPKKYQDIYPLNFESAHWRGLWQALYDVFLYWIRRGIRIFRVDNPHTKAFLFWEWCLAEIHKKYPDVLFLAEAFTRPHVMYSLAKAGFSQSYTYFTWRNAGAELQQYFEEITHPPISDFFRPNLWPQHPRHPPRHPPERRPPRLHAAVHPRRHARRKLRHLWPSLRARREPAFETRQRRVPQQRKSTRSATGTALPPTPSPRSSHRSTASAAKTRPSKAMKPSTSTPPTIPTSSATAKPTATIASS
ncbi:MAG: hypothetical protein WDN23_19610 [Edaphobacter sp.]